jgi:hypothetical protein
MGYHRITGPDGQSYRIQAPDDATPEQINMVASNYISAIPKPEKFIDKAQRIGGDVATGALTGATDVGRTLLNIPGAINKATGGIYEKIPGNKAFLDYLADTSKRSGEIAGEMYEKAGPAALAGRAGAHIAGTLGAAGPVLGGTRALATAFPSLRAAAPYLNTGALGAVEGAYTNPDSPGTSAAIGAVAGPILHQVAKVATGAGRVPDTDILTSAGVDLPAGWASPKRTVAGRLLSRTEEGFSTFPIVGDWIKKRQQAALDQARQAVVQQGQIPGGRPLPKDASIDQMLAQQAEDQAKHVQQATAGVVLRPDQAATQAVNTILHDPKRMIGDAERDKIRAEVDRLIMQHARRGTYRQPTVGPPTPTRFQPRAVSREFDPELLLQGQESLRRLGASGAYGGSEDVVKQHTGQAMRDIADEVYKLVERQSPRAHQALEAIRPQQNVHRIVSEVARDAPKMGEFTFPALARHKDIGDVPNLQTLARAGAEYLPATIPEQSAAPRLLWGLLSLAQPKIAATATAAGGLFGTQYGNKLLLGDTAAQQKLSDLLKHLEVP